MRKKPSEGEVLWAFFLLLSAFIVICLKGDLVKLFEWAFQNILLLIGVGIVCIIICYKVPLPSIIRVILLVCSNVCLGFVIMSFGSPQENTAYREKERKYEEEERERKREVQEGLRRDRARNAAQNYRNFSQEYNNAVSRGDKNGARSAANRRDSAYAEWMKNQ